MPIRSSTATVCAALAGLAACSNGSETSSAIHVSESDSAGVTIVTILGEVSDLPLWRLDDLPDLEISGAAAPYLSSIGQVAFLSDGTVLVEDDQSDELRLFDAAGGRQTSDRRRWTGTRGIPATDDVDGDARRHCLRL